jgi:hypothetical protein
MARKRFPVGGKAGDLWFASVVWPYERIKKKIAEIRRFSRTPGLG